jgi:dTDP-4-amino-4,6-dideoxygalactose transaminase
VELEKQIKQIYDNKIFTNDGPLVKELESELAKFHNTEFCIATCSGSIATVLVLSALTNAPLVKKSRNQVIVPEIHYPNLPELVKWAGLEPVFAPVEKKSGVLSASDVKKLINNKTCAIIALNQVNALCDIDQLESICESSSVPLVFDSVRAFGMKHRHKVLGGFGVAEVYSLGHEKMPGGYGGGYITTNNQLLATQLKSIRNFGFDGIHRFAQNLGLNAKLNEFHAAASLSALSKVKVDIVGYKAAFKKLVNKVAELKHLVIFEPSADIASPCDHLLVDINCANGALEKIPGSENCELIPGLKKHYLNDRSRENLPTLGSHTTQRYYISLKQIDVGEIENLVESLELLDRELDTLN